MINNSTRLPDAYAKDVSSNMYKLFELQSLVTGIMQTDMNDIEASKDLSQATGKTLDLYGGMFGVSRQGATDDQFRVKILNQIGKLASSGDCNSVLRFIAQMLGIEITDIRLVESNMLVAIIGLTTEMLENSGYKSSDISDMLQGLMPIGVALAPPNYAGTLLVQDETAGYADYPTLFAAWIDGQLGCTYLKALQNRSVEESLVRKVGLSGEGTVPAEFLESQFVTLLQQKISGLTFQASGTYEGGTLGIANGEDEQEV